MTLCTSLAHTQSVLPSVFPDCLDVPLVTFTLSQRDQVRDIGPPHSRCYLDGPPLDSNYHDTQVRPVWNFIINIQGKPICIKHETEARVVKANPLFFDFSNTPISHSLPDERHETESLEVEHLLVWGPDQSHTVSPDLGPIHHTVMGISAGTSGESYQDTGAGAYTDLV